VSVIIQTPSDDQALREKMRQQTRLWVEHCQQNKDITSSGGRSQTPSKDVSNTRQSGTILFHDTNYSQHLGFMLSSLNGLVYP
jgi:hypothetical protein